MRLKVLSGLGLVLFGTSLLAAGRSGPIELSAAQRDSVDRGDLVLFTEHRPTSAWPAVTIYAFIDASPEQAAAVFTDYEQHAEYVPLTLKAKISRVVDRATIEVDYTIEVPVFPDEQYTVRNHVTHPDSARYKVNWTMLRATSTKASEGYALFAPHVNARTGKIGTLLEYYNFVTPGSVLAGLPFIRNRTLHQIGETVKSIVRQVEKESGREVEMRPRLTALRSAVAP